jgi:hypothetical protein
MEHVDPTNFLRFDWSAPRFGRTASRLELPLRISESAASVWIFTASAPGSISNLAIARHGRSGTARRLFEI